MPGKSKTNHRRNKRFEYKTNKEKLLWNFVNTY